MCSQLPFLLFSQGTKLFTRLSRPSRSDQRRGELLAGRQRWPSLRFQAPNRGIVGTTAGTLYRTVDSGQPGPPARRPRPQAACGTRLADLGDTRIAAERLEVESPATPCPATIGGPHVSPDAVDGDRVRVGGDCKATHVHGVRRDFVLRITRTEHFPTGWYGNDADVSWSGRMNAASRRPTGLWVRRARSPSLGTRLARSCVSPLHRCDQRAAGG